MIANMTSLISAGCALEDDSKFMLIQGLDDGAAAAVADWLAVATGGPVCLRHMNLMRGTNYLIHSSPETIDWK